MVAILQYKDYLQDLPSSKLYLEMMASDTATEKITFWHMAFRLLISTGKTNVLNWEFLIFYGNQVRFKECHSAFKKFLLRVSVTQERVPDFRILLAVNRKTFKVQYCKIRFIKLL